MKNKIIYLFTLIALTAGLSTLPSCQSGSGNKTAYHTLIVTGQNNHSWQESTPILKQILENSGLFSVDVAQTPKTGENMSQFKPDFSQYDVVVLDYVGDPWPEETRTAFEQYVSGGGGVVVYHAADNAFRNWVAYNQMIGIGGWGNRNESDGPYIRWKDGKTVRINEPGPTGNHGPQRAFQVTIREPEHPITKGLPKIWLHAKDELYQQLRGPAENLTVLATAYADTAKGGTGGNEPVLMTIRYGKGRIFHTTLGHVMGKGPFPAVECVGFIVTLQRGAEWAASGKVTQEIPDDFPQFNVTSRWPLFRPMNLDEILDQLREYKPGDNRMPEQDLTNLLRGQYNAGTFDEIEDQLLKFIIGNGSAAGKNYVCRELSLYGSENALPALHKLMTKEPDVAEMARFAYERISGEYSN